MAYHVNHLRNLRRYKIGRFVLLLAGCADWMVFGDPEIVNCGGMAELPV